MRVGVANGVRATRLPLDCVSDIAGDLGGAIHIWHVQLDSPGSRIALDVCSDAERARARNIPSHLDRQRFLATRAVLRTILAGYTGQAAERIRLSVTDGGKPFIEGGGVQFNLSHSEAHAVFAVRAEGEVGVDFQLVRPVTDEMAIARSLFADGEIAQLEKLTGNARRLHFFRLWTCREAVLKTVGVGITARVSDLVLAPDVRGALRVASQPPEWGRIGLGEFQPAPGNLGAVAWMGEETGTLIRHLEVESDESVDSP